MKFFLSSYFFYSILITLSVQIADAQNPSLVADVNSTSLIPAPDFYGRLNTGEGLLLFNATDNHGIGLWRSDGTSEGTFFLTNAITLIGENTTVEYNGEIFFEGYDGKLWKTDGTPEGTLLVKSFFQAGIGSYYGSPVVNGLLYFFATDEEYVSGLWKTDGTTGGTTMVSDIVPNQIVSFNSKIIFSGYSSTSDNELYISDGTESGTTLLKDIYPGTIGSQPHNFVELNGAIYFFANDPEHAGELWKTDGSSAGTELIKVFAPGEAFYGGLIMSAVNDKLLIYAYADGKGNELWVSDGTTDGTQFLFDIYPGITSSNFGYPPPDFFVEKNVAYFPAQTSSNHTEFWRSDGTLAGTHKVKNINGQAPQNFAALPGSRFVFTIYSFSNDELWVSDGTASGTYSINKQFYDNQGLLSPTSFNGDVFFVARGTGYLATQLCFTDGTQPGTQAFPVYTNQTNSSNPTQMIRLGDNNFVFTANDGIHGREIFATDGISGATLLQDIIAGISSPSYSFCPFSINGTAYFGAPDTIVGDFYQDYNLWKTDGTVQGTVQIAAANPRFDFKCASLNGVLYFINQTGDGFEYSTQLWESDGTSAGTFRIKDINPSGNDQAGFPVMFNNAIYFAADDGIHGPELWKTDGTQEGTVMVKDINPGVAGSAPNSLITFSGKFFFGVNSGAYGLWTSDGTAEGTVLLNPSIPIYFNLTYPVFAVSGNELYYYGSTSANGYELWKTDGTVAGTHLVKDIKEGTPSTSISWLTDVNGTLFFIVVTSQNATQIWKSDGTEEGTVKVISFPVDQNILAKELTNVNGVLYLVLENYTLGSQNLWRTDGTKCHTQQLDFYSGGDDNTNILLADSSSLFLSLNSEPFGVELWIYETSPIPTVEVCNGFDDDCDGLIDEDGVSVSISTDDPLVLCEGDPITLTASGNNIASYQWYKNGSPVSGATNSSFTSFYGTDYYVVAYGNGDCISTSNTITVQRKARPYAMITVLGNGNLDLCLGAVELQSNSGNDLSWQWLLNGEPINGATDQNYTPVVPGKYRVKVFKSNGCGSSSKKVVVTSSCKEEGENETGSFIVIYPNPTSSEAIIEIRMEAEADVTLELTDISGRKVKTIFSGNIPEGDDQFNFDREGLSSGVYFLQLKSKAGIVSGKLIIE